MINWVLVLFISNLASAGYNDGGSGSRSAGPSSEWSQKYEARKSQRFDLISYLTEQRRVKADQDSRLRSGGGTRWFYPDFVLQGYSGTPTVQRDGSDLGKMAQSGGRFQFLLDNIISQASIRRILNVDIGFEAFYEDEGKFVAGVGSTAADMHGLVSGGGLLIRPLGRSSQDSGFLVKAGSLRVSNAGILTASTTQIEGSASYYGGEARLYILPFLGLHADYLRTASATSASLLGSWSMTDSKYGAFLELYMLQLGAYVQNRIWELSLDAGGSVKDSHSTTLLSVGLFF